MTETKMTEKRLFLTEEEKLKRRLQMSYTERFYMLMRLIKIGKKMRTAKIINPEK